MCVSFVSVTPKGSSQESSKSSVQGPPTPREPWIFALLVARKFPTFTFWTSKPVTACSPPRPIIIASPVKSATADQCLPLSSRRWFAPPPHPFPGASSATNSRVYWIPIRSPEKKDKTLLALTGALYIMISTSLFYTSLLSGMWNIDILIILSSLAGKYWFLHWQYYSPYRDVFLDTSLGMD